MDFYIRLIESYKEILEMHHLQLEIWGLDDPTWGLHPPLVKTVAANGGMVLGAFDKATGKMVGFLFGFIGRGPNGMFKICSQIMGVLKPWRSRGVAEVLKWAQRDHTLNQELSLVTWTFDPLEGPNAYLNFHKLRGVSHNYIRDYYGSDFGALNAGLPSDRLVITWWVASPHVVQRLPTDSSGAEPIFTIAGQGLERYVSKANLNLTAKTLRLDSVSDLQALKKADLALALDWRTKLRQSFEHYFAEDYVATDFISTVANGIRHNRYMLQKNSPELRAELGVE